MHQDIVEILSNLDTKFASLTTKQLQKEFDKIPLEIFGKLQIERPSEFPNISSWLPKMPSTDIQKSWTGCTDYVLMQQSVNFIRLSVSKYHEIACKPMSQSKVLDFGCGWGRLIRLLYKYVPVENIYAVDPWDKSLEICHDCNLHGHLYLSDYTPKQLPTPSGLKFDFIVAFSVFTHLSESVTKLAAQTLKNYLSDEGVLALTIRPKEYWSFLLGQNFYLSDDVISELLHKHEQRGFAFAPHDRELVDGEVTYGETSISIEYIRKNFVGLDIVSVEWSEIDPFQLIVFLKRTK